MKLLAHFVHFSSDWIKFGAGDVRGCLLSAGEFSKNRCNRISALFNGIK
jgi:hypothetical protein